jgi:hypothetical protein
VEECRLGKAKNEHQKLEDKKLQACSPTMMAAIRLEFMTLPAGAQLSVVCTLNENTTAAA